METTPELEAVSDEYHAARRDAVGRHVEPLLAKPMKDRDIFDLLGFD